MSSPRPQLGSFAVGQVLPAYTVRAHNGAALTENKIHDNEVAKQYGFAGGLVPGVTDYAYMTRPIVEALGPDWVEHGSMAVRFLKPLYEGQETRVVATVLESSPAAVSFEVKAFNEGGELCAVGTAALVADPPEAPAATAVPIAALPSARPEASPQSLAIGTVLGSLETPFDQQAAHLPYLEEVTDDLPLYYGEGAVAHPGYTIRFANSILVANVLLEPWIHVSSDLQHFSLVRNSDRLSTRAVVTDLFERKAHEFVDLDVMVVANETRPVLRLLHRSIYKVRMVPEA